VEFNAGKERCDEGGNMIWERIERLLIQGYAVDLGTANTLIYSRAHGIVLSEPTAIATDKSTGDVVAVGREALNMLGREPREVTIHRPIQTGVVADYELTEKMLRCFLQQALGHKPRSWTFLELVMGTSSAATYIERRAIVDAAKRAGGFHISLVEDGVAVALSSGLLLQDPRACLIVDIGGGTTDISIVSPVGVIASRSLDVAGIAMDRAIGEYLRHHHHITVGEQTAEMIKITLGAALPMPHARSMQVAGKSLNNGSPREVTITSNEVFQVLDELLRTIINGVYLVLEQASPETAADLCRTGITLTGGGSLLRDLEIRFRNEFEIPVYRVENPLESVALGLGYLLEDGSLLDHFRVDENAVEWLNDAELIYSAVRSA